MKKIASILFAVMLISILSVAAQASEGTGDMSTGGTAAETSTVVACIQTAVETRDTAIITAFDTYAVAVKAALTTRKDALKAGWALAIAKERRTAIMSAWKAYKTALQTARGALKASKKLAWDGFKTASKACKPTKTQDNTNQSVDNTL